MEIDMEIDKVSIVLVVSCVIINLLIVYGFYKSDYLQEVIPNISHPTLPMF